MDCNAGIFNLSGNICFLTLETIYNGWNFQLKWQYYIFYFRDKILKVQGYLVKMYGILISSLKLSAFRINIDLLKMALNVKNHDNECLSLASLQTLEFDIDTSQENKTDKKCCSIRSFPPH